MGSTQGSGGGGGTAGSGHTPQARAQPGGLLATFLEFLWPGRRRILQPLQAASGGWLCPSHPLRDFLPHAASLSDTGIAFPLPVQRQQPFTFLTFSVSPFTIAQFSALPFSGTPVGADLPHCPAGSPLPWAAGPQLLTHHLRNDPQLANTCSARPALIGTRRFFFLEPFFRWPRSPYGCPPSSLVSHSSSPAAFSRSLCPPLLLHGPQPACGPQAPFPPLLSCLLLLLRCPPVLPGL